MAHKKKIITKHDRIAHHEELHHQSLELKVDALLSIQNKIIFKLNSIIIKLKELGTDSAKINELTGQISSSSDQLQKAVTENTPTEPPITP